MSQRKADSDDRHGTHGGPQPPADRRAPRSAKAAPPEVAGAPKDDPGPVIVGVGASAGGLEAIEALLRDFPADSPVAFAVIQHLDPNHEGAMPQLLQRITGMEVVEVKDGMKARAAHVYLIPPNKDMSIIHGVFRLFAPAAPRGLRLPIDFFLRTLADDQGERSIGVILSGMGSDGCLGLRAIREKGGFTFVQEPSTSKFDGMPRSAIDAGLADVVAPVEELSERIMALVKQPFSAVSRDRLQETKSQSALDKILVLIRSETGNDFSQYKKSTLYRRIDRRMNLHQIDRIAAYVDFLRDNPQEVQLLFHELLVGVTSFLRDPSVWDRLREEALPAVLRTRPANWPVRAWVPGCSTGEEAYSLAMVLKEVSVPSQSAVASSIQIFGTDLDRGAVDRARQGSYPPNIAADVSSERLSRFFVKEDDGYRISAEIREMVIFAPHNLVMDPPFTKLDIIVCRNLLIYLTPELQKTVLSLFHYALNPGGILMLGTAETVGGSTNLFTAIDSKARIYRRSDAPHSLPHPMQTRSPLLKLDVLESEVLTPPVRGLQHLADRAILDYFSPASVLVNAQGEILYLNGKTGKYLEPPVGKANWNIFVMAREGLRYELGAAFQKALRAKDRVEFVVPKANDQGLEPVGVSVQPLFEPEALQGTFLVAFRDAPRATRTRSTKAGAKSGGVDSATTAIELDLQRSRQELQTVREEMQASQEELRSANEELQSTNEELQSTNEELTTSKEEMQSMNEELQTVNAELQVKVDELSQTTSDMKNLLDSTEIATLFLDGSSKIRRFTTQAARLIRLIPGDIGRPVSDIASNLVYPELVDDVDRVMETLAVIERQIMAQGERWFASRIMPYRTFDNRIDGVVMTFVDITSLKVMEMSLREKEREIIELRAARREQR